MARGWAACVLVAGCWTSSPTPPPVAQRACEALSKEARLPLADGGYRRLDVAGMRRLRTAIDDANTNHFRFEQTYRGIAGYALAAAIHDLREELHACVAAGPRAARYAVRAEIHGHVDVGAHVSSVEVVRIDDTPDAVNAAIQACVGDILKTTSLPPTDGGEFQMPLESDVRCVEALPPKRRAD